MLTVYFLLTYCLLCVSCVVRNMWPPRSRGREEKGQEGTLALSVLAGRYSTFSIHSPLVKEPHSNCKGVWERGGALEVSGEFQLCLTHSVA